MTERSTPWFRFAASALSLLAGLSFGNAATAQGRPALAAGVTSDVRNERLEAFTPAERRTIAPLLARGVVSLVEFSDDDHLPGIVVASEIAAPAATVMDLISEPSRYPRFMPALDSVTVQSRRDRTIAYDWSWRTALFTMRGSNVMTVYRAPATRTDLAHRVSIRSERGDLGTGRIEWRVYPVASGRSLLVLSMRLDLRNANYVARELSTAARSINRSINLSLAHVMLLGTRREAERLARPRDAAAPTQPDVPPLERPDVDVNALAPLLGRGDLLVLELAGQRLSRVSVMGRMGAAAEPVRAIMNDPRAFGSALVPGSRAEVVRQDDAGTLFEWEINLPLVGSEGRMLLRDDGTVVNVDAVSGAFNQGRWRFATPVLPWNEAVLVGWASFDPADSSWLVRSVVSSNPDFGHGLAVASELMVLRAIRARLTP